MSQVNPYFVKGRQEKLSLRDEVWEKILDPHLFEIARKHATERPFTSTLLNEKKHGIYYCRLCGNKLFKSESKFDSGCGWPSFFEAYGKESLLYKPDLSMGMNRTEIRCGKCLAHLGHVFEDGPKPTHLRYCLNGSVLVFEEEIQKK